MFKFFKWLIGLRERKIQEIGTDKAAEPGGIEVDVRPRQEDTGRDPITVRGKHWPNTSEERWSIPQRPGTADFSSVESLMRGLGKLNLVEVRRSSAEGLGCLGADARQAIPALLQAAVDSDRKVREAAFNALKAIDPNWTKNPDALKAVPILIEALKSSSAGVSPMASKLLTLIGPPAVPQLAQALSTLQNSAGQVFVIRILSQIGPSAAEAIPELNRALGSSIMQARLAAARALTKIGPDAESSLPALIYGLSDQYADVREAMACCLASLGEAAEPAIPALLNLLPDRDPKVREAAETALEHIGPKAVPALMEVIRASDMRLLKASIEQVMKVSHLYVRFTDKSGWKDEERAIQNLSWVMLEAEDELVSLHAAHQAALRLIGKFGPEAASAVPVVGLALHSINPNVNLAAISALGEIGPRARGLLPELLMFLTDGRKSLREAAAEALGKVDINWREEPEVGQLIEDLMQDLSTPGKASENSVEALILIGHPAIPILIEALNSEDWIVRERATIALGKFGPGARSAISALNKALQDRNRRVQDEAAKALKKIDQ